MSNAKKAPESQGYTELTVTGPLGHGIRFQWLAINAVQIKCMTPPSWEQFTRYALFNRAVRNTMNAFYPNDGFVLETLRKGQGYYKNIMGITMYNEGQDEFLYTMRGVWRNIKSAEEKKYNFGKSLAVVLVDGFAELHKNGPLLDVLENRYKLYSKSAVERALEHYKTLKKQWNNAFNDELEGRKKKYMEDQEMSKLIEINAQDQDIVFAFESRLAMGSADLYATTESTPEEPAIDVLFIVKAENKKKLHSHLWLFYGFCMHFQPRIVFLIDMGTEPKKKSLLALHEHFAYNKTTGGCCGEIIVKDAPWYDPLVGAQWFEYKIGHIIYKTFESCMGFIPVLPGAFSAYRWQVLIEEDSAVLRKYLLPFINPLELDWTLTNIYFLAEDRIMSEEIVKVGDKRSYSLRFVKGAKALTEGVDQLVNLIKQRRRWINGSWFALIKILKCFRLLQAVCCHSYHRICWKLTFAFQTFYMLAIMLMTWFSIGIFYVCYSMVVTRVFCPENSDNEDDNDNVDDSNDSYDVRSKLSSVCGVMLYLYIFFMACNILVSLATAPDNVKSFWKFLCIFFSFCGLFIAVGSFKLVIENNLEMSTFATYEALGLIVIMTVAIICYWENLFTMLLFSFYYMLLMPTYINILMVYAVCKTDDVTWGTRGKDEKGSSLQDEFNWKKTLFLTLFAACNILMGGLVE